MWLEWNIWLGLMLVIILFINALVSNYDMVFQRQVSICNGCHYLSYWCCGAEMWYPHIIINFVNYVPPPFHRSYPSVEICYYIAAPCGVAFDNRNLESIQWGQNRSTPALKYVIIYNLWYGIGSRLLKAWHHRSCWCTYILTPNWFHPTILLMRPIISTVTIMTIFALMPWRLQRSHRWTVMWFRQSFGKIRVFILVTTVAFHLKVARVLSLVLCHDIKHRIGK